MTAPHTLESREDRSLAGGERHLLELIGTGASLNVVLDALCRLIDEQSGLMSSVFLLDQEGERMSLAAGPHLPEGWSRAARSFRLTPTTGSCGAAVSRREQVIVSDVLASPLFAQWHEVARRSRIRAVWSTPFFSKHGSVLGTFAVLNHETGTPTDAHLNLVARAAYLAGIAVERHQTEESLRESERRFSRAFYANPACMTITRFSDGRFLYVNDAFVRLFGYSRAEAIGQTALGLGLYADPAQRSLVMQLLAAGQLHDVEVAARTKSGATIDVVLSMERIELLGDESVLAIATDITNRKQAEEALRESDERFRQIAEHIREVFWMCTADFTQMLYVSPGYERIWGHTCESLYRDPRSWIAAVHPDDRARVTSIIETERDRGFEVEYRLVRPDGTIRWIWDRGFPIKDGSGRLYRVAGISEDITERRRVDEQLRTSEYLLAEAQRLAHIGSWNWDLLTSAVTWSDELYRIFGLQSLEIDPAREGMRFVHESDREAVMSAIETTFKTKEPYSFFYRIRRRDGTERILHSIGYLVSNEQGEPIRVFGTTQDVTERKQAEEALQRSEQLLRLVVEAMPVGVVVVDPAGNVILDNQASGRIWSGMIQSGPERYARSQGWWHDTGKKVEPDEWASRRALVKGETAINEVIDIETFDGVRKVIHNSAVPIRDERQAIVGAVIINEDISASKAAERDLEASMSQMQTLATRLMYAQDDERRRIAEILHETTAQDLAGLKMLLARLQRTIGSVSTADRAVLEESIELAERSMAGIRTLSYLLYPPFLDENGLLSALRWYAAGFSQRSGIAVELDLPPTFGRLPRDVETTLFRVVQEALINIHRHADSPIARIHLRVGPDGLVLEIEDHGRGMPAGLLTPLAPGGGAVGVGIAGMRERLKQLGGAIDIESSDRGTIVRARILIASEPSTVGARDQRENEGVG